MQQHHHHQRNYILWYFRLNIYEGSTGCHIRNSAAPFVNDPWKELDQPCSTLIRERRTEWQKLLLSTTAWEILYKQPGKKQSHVSAIRKITGQLKINLEKPGSALKSNNSLFLVPGDIRTAM